MKKKILIITNGLQNGGTEKITAMIANYLGDKGYDVTLLLINNTEQHFDIHSSVSLVDLSLSNIKKAFWPIVFHIKKEKPDMVFSTLTAVNVMIAIIKMLFPKTKFVVRESTILSENNKKFKFRRLIDFIIRWRYNKFDKIIAQSEAMKEDIIARYHVRKEKLAQIYNPLMEIPDLKTMNKIQNKVPQFITVGNIRPEKGYDRMIEILSGLTFDFKYTILGDGSDMSLIRQLVKKYHLEDKVFFEGKVNHPYKYLFSSDIYLQTSYYEGFPNAVLEANACGIPVIAYDSPGGTKEIIVHGFNGFLVEDANKASFCRILEDALNYPFEGQKIADYISKKFDYNTIMQSYENEFKKVLQS